MEGNYPSARGRERQDSPWLASQCCYAVVRSERERGGGRKGGREGGKEAEGERERERPGRLWGRRRPHLQCCV